MSAHPWIHTASRLCCRPWAAAWLAMALPCGVAPSAAAAADIGGTYLTWQACPGDPKAATGAGFDCIADAGVVYTLVGTFSLDTDVKNAVSLDADLNVAFAGAAAVPSFWQIDLGGCNASAFSLLKGMPSGCAGHLNAFCGGDSNLCDLVYTTSVFPSTNLMRMSLTLGRAALHSVNLAGGQRYFAFAVSIPMYGASSCLGCAAPCAIGFSHATIYSVDDLGRPMPPVTVSSSYPGASACATANGGTSECATVPVRRTTWGRLQSLYR